MMLKAVLFDFDLTLADSTDAAGACIRHALEKMGTEPVDSGRMNATIGLSLDATFESLTGETDPDLRSDFRRFFIEHADRIMVARTELLPGALDALATLRHEGLRLGIVSTKYRYRIEAILLRHGAADLFQTVVGGEEVTEHKPDPEGLLLGLERLDVEGAEAVYVGDHLVDAEAAARAPVPFVGVLTGNTDPSEYRAFPHLQILEGVSELPSFLSGRLGGAPFSRTKGRAKNR